VARDKKVARPIKRSEFTIEFASIPAQRGWVALSATIRGPLADAWDFLTRTPLTITPTNYPLKGELATITRDGNAYQRWQHKPTLKGGARIWFYVDEHVVRLEQVHTHHPNATK
jgi:hypothetical protein